MQSQEPIDIRPLIHSRERPLLLACAAISVGVLVVAIAFAPELLLWLAGFWLISLALRAYAHGHIRGNAVRVSEHQLPAIHQMVVGMSERLSLPKAPSVYVMQADGALNAFAARLVRREIVVLYSDLLELALGEDRDQLAFVLGHELAHVKRRHTLWGLLLGPAMMVPFLNQAYSRACEYTCDRVAAALAPTGAPGGLLVLAAGKRLYRDLDVATYASQTESEGGFAVWLTEKFSSHPRLPRRVRALEAHAAA